MSAVYYGADVSHYQGTINWTTYAANKDFVIIKAGGCDAGYYQDSSFSTFQAGARSQAGLLIGYYYFGDRNADAATAANSFISILGTLQNGEILALDIEGANYPQDAWADTFSLTLHNYYGFYPFVYMSRLSPTNTSFSWPATNAIDPLWLADPSASPTDFSITTGNADDPWGGLPAPNYRILQNPITSIPGVQFNADNDTFYSPNGSKTDWDVLGYQGGSPPGEDVLTFADSVSTSVTFSQPEDQTIIVPKYNYDHVLYSDTLTASVTTSSGVASYGPISTGINQLGYPVGNFSFDGGASYADYSFSFSGNFGQYYGFLPLWQVQPYIDDNGDLYFNVTYPNYLANGDQSISLILNIAVLATYDPSPIESTSLAQPTAYSNLVPNITPPYATYRRISHDSEITTSGGSSYAHRLGAIPNILFWQKDTSGDIDLVPSTWSNLGQAPSGSPNLGVSMDSTYIYFYADSLTSAIPFRVYYDN